MTGTIFFFFFYNAVTLKKCFVKGSHKYDVYLVEENKAHLNWPYCDFGLTQCVVRISESELFTGDTSERQSFTRSAHVTSRKVTFYVRWRHCYGVLSKETEGLEKLKECIVIAAISKDFVCGVIAATTRWQTANFLAEKENRVRFCWFSRTTIAF